MKKTLRFLKRNGQYKIAIPILMVGFILQGILIGKYLPEFLLYSQGIKNPDQLFSYDLAYLKDLYQTLGNSGRSFYVEMLIIDFFFATVSGIGYTLLLAALIKKEKWFLVLPLLLVIADILENTSQLSLMNLYPKINSSGVIISSFFSSSKMAFGLISISLILFFIGKNIINWFKHRNAG